MKQIYFKEREIWITMYTHTGKQTMGQLKAIPSQNKE